jgi:hypothetical protein
MDEAASGGWNASQKRKRFLIATGTEGYGSKVGRQMRVVQHGR